MRVDVERTGVPFTRAIGAMAAGSVRPVARLTLEDDDGTTGVAEACPWPGLHDVTLDGLALELERCAPSLPSFARDLTLTDLAARCAHAAPSPLVAWAFFSASIDARARRARTTTARLLGARVSAVRTAALVLAEESLGDLALGAARTIKLKVTDVERGVARAREAHALWPRARLRVDMNGALTVDAARAFVDATRALPIDFIEDPVAHDALAVCAASGVPLALDAGVASLDDGAMRALAPRALVAKPSVVGPVRTLSLALLARSMHVPFVVSSAFCTRRARAFLAALQGALDPASCAGLGTGRFLDEGSPLEDADFTISLEERHA